MICQSSNSKKTRGFTIVEFVVASAVGLMVITAIGFLSYYATRSFVSIGNYADLDRKSRSALDLMSRALRQSTGVVSFQTNASSKSLRLTNTVTGADILLSYDPNARVMSFSSSAPLTSTTLTQCDRWDFSLYQRTPLITGTNVIFYPATNTSGVIDPTLCKIVNMSWNCSRTILGQKVNTETIQTAQIVLRNKS